MITSCHGVGKLGIVPLQASDPFQGSEFENYERLSLKHTSERKQPDYQNGVSQGGTESCRT